MAIPILERQKGNAIGVIQIYNFDPDNFVQRVEESQLWTYSQFGSSLLFSVETLQGLMLNNDTLEAQFNLVNDGVILVTSGLVIRKMNKAAKIMLNREEGWEDKPFTEVLGSGNPVLAAIFARCVEEKEF